MCVIGAALLAGAALAQQKTIAIATGGTGGVYYPLGGGLANVLSKNLPGVQATAEVTGGSVDNLKLIGTGQSELAFSMADAALDAFNGQDKFKSGEVAVRTLMVLYPNRMHVVTIDGTGELAFIWYLKSTFSASLCTATRSAFLSKMSLTML